MPVAVAERKESSSREDFGELIRILCATEVKVPAPLTADKKQDVTSDLFRMFAGNKDVLINGVTNAPAVGEAESFFYFNICPKLMVHNLVSNEKVPGARYRRSYVNSRGLSLLAEVERRLKKKTPDDAPAAVDSTLKKSARSRKPKQQQH